MLTVINASAAVTLLEQRPEKNLGSERDSNPRPLRCRIRPLSCGFDSSVGRARHRHRRGRGFESRSEPEFFSGLCSSSVTAALALMTVLSSLFAQRTVYPFRQLFLHRLGPFDTLTTVSYILEWETTRRPWKLICLPLAMSTAGFRSEKAEVVKLC